MTHVTLSRLGALLLRLRGDRTQADVAKAAALSQNSISCYERGTVEPPAASLRRLLDALEVSDEDRREVGALMAGALPDSDAASSSL